MGEDYGPQRAATCSTASFDDHRVFDLRILIVKLLTGPGLFFRQVWFRHRLLFATQVLVARRANLLAGITQVKGKKG